MSRPRSPTTNLDAIFGALAHPTRRAILFRLRNGPSAFTPRYLEHLWLRDFPRAEALRLDNAGHYLQEDAHERIVPALVEFLHGNRQARRLEIALSTVSAQTGGKPIQGVWRLLAGLRQVQAWPPRSR
ncbi:MAG TPA: hypothetical protein VJT32_07950 [bacterium]|nr:hypothetical protein [bacterium]